MIGTLLLYLEREEDLGDVDTKIVISRGHTCDVFVSQKQKIGG